VAIAFLVGLRDGLDEPPEMRVPTASDSRTPFDFKSFPS